MLREARSDVRRSKFARGEVKRAPIPVSAFGQEGSCVTDASRRLKSQSKLSTAQATMEAWEKENEK